MQTIYIQRHQTLTFYAKKGTFLYVNSGRLSVEEKPCHLDGYSTTASLMLTEEQSHTVSCNTWLKLNAFSHSRVLLEQKQSLLARMRQQEPTDSANAFVLLGASLYRLSRKILF
ncbi:hypothetical protein ACO0K0_14355 [Undibacterium sp. SXout11W]|uniref:hypothetical protein n=1 Tax=Undibacterium sp. SXout11W TaxID=3413050 RepID=UPI003BEF7A98